LKCDERLPFCLRCEKGGRECSYPLQLEATGLVALRGSGKAASTHIPEFLYNQNPDPDLDGFDFPRSPSPAFADRLFDGNDGLSGQSALMALSGVPRSPSSSKHPAVRFFFNFHQACVVPYHYFRSYDYHELHLKLVPSMAEDSTCLSYAISAFSAMVYSAQVNIAAREVAFYLYSMALKELFAELESVQNNENLDQLVATALELAVTDVHLQLEPFLIIAVLRRGLKVFATYPGCRSTFSKMLLSGATMLHNPWTVFARVVLRVRGLDLCDVGSSTLIVGYLENRKRSVSAYSRNRSAHGQGRAKTSAARRNMVGAVCPDARSAGYINGTKTNDQIAQRGRANTSPRPTRTSNPLRSIARGFYEFSSGVGSPRTRKSCHH
jgi:hypothetical protein